MGQKDMVFPEHPAKRGNGIGADPDKCRMADGDKPGKAGDQIETHNGNHRHQDIIDHQHVLVIKLDEQRPEEKGKEQQAHGRPVEVGEKDPLLLLVGGEIVACGKPTIR